MYASLILKHPYIFNHMTPIKNIYFDNHANSDIIVPKPNTPKVINIISDNAQKRTIGTTCFLNRP